MSALPLPPIRNREILSKLHSCIYDLGSNVFVITVKWLSHHNNLDDDARNQLRRDTKKILKKLSDGVETVETLDISDLYNLLQWTCHLASSSDPVWQEEHADETQAPLESLLRNVKEDRNTIAHFKQEMRNLRDEDLKERADKLVLRLKSILTKAGNKANKAPAEIQTKINEIEKRIDSIIRYGNPDTNFLLEIKEQQKARFSQNVSEAEWKDCYSEPTFICHAGNKLRDTPLHCILKCFDQESITVLTGIAGEGKTAFVRFLYGSWISGELIHFNNFSAFEAVFSIECRSLRTRSIHEFLEGELPHAANIFSNTSSLSKQLEASRILWVFDGYDERTAEGRDFIHSLINNLSISHKILVTVRTEFFKTLKEEAQFKKYCHCSFGKLTDVNCKDMFKKLGITSDSMIQKYQSMMQSSPDNLNIPLTLKLFTDYALNIGEFEGDTEVPNSLTLLYKVSVWHKKENLAKRIKNQSSLLEKTIKAKLAQWFQFLCKQSFDLLLNDCSGYLSESVQEELERKADEYLISEECMNTFFSGNSFFHLTQQYYLASLYFVTTLKSSSHSDDANNSITAGTDLFQNNYQIKGIINFAVRIELEESKELSSGVISKLSNFIDLMKLHDFIPELTIISEYNRELSKTLAQQWISNTKNWTISSHESKALILLLEFVTPQCIKYDVGCFSDASTSRVEQCSDFNLVIENCKNRVNSNLDICFNDMASVEKGSDMTSDKFLNCISTSMQNIKFSRFTGALDDFSLLKRFCSKIDSLHLRIKNDKAFISFGQLLIEMSEIYDIYFLSRIPRVQINFEITSEAVDMIKTLMECRFAIEVTEEIDYVPITFTISPMEDEPVGKFFLVFLTFRFADFLAELMEFAIPLSIDCNFQNTSSEKDIIVREEYYRDFMSVIENSNGKHNLNLNIYFQDITSLEDESDVTVDRFLKGISSLHQNIKFLSFHGTIDDVSFLQRFCTTIEYLCLRFRNEEALSCLHQLLSEMYEGSTLDYVFLWREFRIIIDFGITFESVKLIKELMELNLTTTVNEKSKNGFIPNSFSIRPSQDEPIGELYLEFNKFSFVDFLAHLSGFAIPLDIKYEFQGPDRDDLANLTVIEEYYRDFIAVIENSNGKYNLNLNINFYDDESFKEGSNVTSDRYVKGIPSSCVNIKILVFKGALDDVSLLKGFCTGIEDLHLRIANANAVGCLVQSLVRMSDGNNLDLLFSREKLEIVIDLEINSQTVDLIKKVLELKLRTEVIEKNKSIPNTFSVRPSQDEPVGELYLILPKFSFADFLAHLSGFLIPLDIKYVFQGPYNDDLTVTEEYYRDFISIIENSTGKDNLNLLIEFHDMMTSVEGESDRTSDIFLKGILAQCQNIKILVFMVTLDDVSLLKSFCTEIDNVHLRFTNTKALSSFVQLVTEMPNRNDLGYNFFKTEQGIEIDFDITLEDVDLIKTLMELNLTTNFIEKYKNIPNTFSIRPSQAEPVGALSIVVRKFRFADFLAHLSGFAIPILINYDCCEFGSDDFTVNEEYYRDFISFIENSNGKHNLNLDINYYDWASLEEGSDKTSDRFLKGISALSQNIKFCQFTGSLDDVSLLNRFCQGITLCLRIRNEKAFSCFVQLLREMSEESNTDFLMRGHTAKLDFDITSEVLYLIKNLLELQLEIKVTAEYKFNGNCIYARLSEDRPAGQLSLFFYKLSLAECRTKLLALTSLYSSEYQFMEHEGIH